MSFKFVVLWTDVALWAMFAALIAYIRHARARARRNCRATWGKVLRDPAALGSAFLLLLFIGVTMLDSVHFRRALAPSAGQAAGTVFYDTRTESLLDLLLARQLQMRESSYSEPLAWRGFAKQPIERDGQTVREHPAPGVRRRAPEVARDRMGRRHHRPCAGRRRRRPGRRGWPRAC